MYVVSFTHETNLHYAYKHCKSDWQELKTQCVAVGLVLEIPCQLTLAFNYACIALSVVVVNNPKRETGV